MRFAGDVSPTRISVCMGTNLRKMTRITELREPLYFAVAEAKILSPLPGCFRLIYNATCLDVGQYPVVDECGTARRLESRTAEPGCTYRSAMVIAGDEHVFVWTRLSLCVHSAAWPVQVGQGTVQQRRTAYPRGHCLCGEQPASPSLLLLRSFAVTE